MSTLHPGAYMEMPNGRHVWNGERWVPPWECVERGDGRIDVPAPRDEGAA